MNDSKNSIYAKTNSEKISLTLNKKYKRLSQNSNEKSSSYNPSLSRTMTFLLPSFMSVALAATVFTLTNDNTGIAVPLDENDVPSTASSKAEISVPLINNVPHNKENPVNSTSSKYENTFMSSEKSYDYRSETNDSDEDDELVKASGLYINDEFIGATESQAELDFLLNGMLNKKSAKEQDAICYFAENIECVTGIYPPESIMSYNEIKDAVNGKKVENTLYTANSGDTVESIAAAKNVSVESVCEANQLSTESKLSEGDILSVPEEKPYLSFCVEKNIEYEKEIPYNKVIEYNDNQYEGYSNIKTQGTNGVMLCIDNVKYENGVEVYRTPFSEEVKTPAIDMVVEVGTKSLNSKPSTQKTENDEDSATEKSNFIWPVDFTHNITSFYGPRWGSFHNGIDIAGEVSYGQDIFASDQGVVVKAGDLNDGYGIYIVIDHGNGYRTLYAHTSKLYVQVGQTVSRGDKIAEIGSTGNSTGPHLHFEIIYNNKTLDPLNFVS